MGNCFSSGTSELVRDYDRPRSRPRSPSYHSRSRSRRRSHGRSGGLSRERRYSSSHTSPRRYRESSVLRELSYDGRDIFTGRRAGSERYSDGTRSVRYDQDFITDGYRMFTRDRAPDREGTTRRFGETFDRIGYSSGSGSGPGPAGVSFDDGDKFGAYQRSERRYTFTGGSAGGPSGSAGGSRTGGGGGGGFDFGTRRGSSSGGTRESRGPAGGEYRQPWGGIVEEVE